VPALHRSWVIPTVTRSDGLPLDEPPASLVQAGQPAQTSAHGFPVGESRGRRAPSHQPVLAVRALSKTFVETPVLTGVDLTIGAGEIHALLGENGSGKSTLIRILSGYHEPDPGGEILIGGRKLEPGSAVTSYALGCRFVHQDLGLVENMSVLDNLSFGAGFPCWMGTIRAEQARQRARQDLGRIGLNVDPTALVRELSLAMKTGVVVARALRGSEDNKVKLLVLDEPTATLPESEVDQLLAIVRSIASDGVAVLYVTHRLDEVFEIAKMVTVLRDGHKIADRVVESLDRAELIELLVGREVKEVRSASSGQVVDPNSEPIAEICDIDAGPIKGASFDVRPGEILGIAGITGSGREALLPAVFGATDREGGTVRIGGTVLPGMRPDLSISLGVAYLPADRRALGGIMALSAQENISLADLAPLWRAPLLRRGLERAEATSWFERLGIRPVNGKERPLSTFSGGNQQKILIGKWLRRRPRLLLLDEPTQGVDIGAKADLHGELVRAAADGAAVVVSSSDTDELAALCHRVLVFRRGRVVADLRDQGVSVQHISREALGRTEGSNHDR
jgi:ribose transport system ATP-binding protein